MSARRLLAAASIRLLSVLQPLLVPWHRRTVARLASKGLHGRPPVFVVGAPRSGSTLLYKALVDRFDLGYVSNLVACLPQVPTVGLRIARLLRGTRPSAGYESHYGRISGWKSPHEAGQLWYRWFPRPPHVHVGAGETPSAVLAEVRYEVTAMTALLGRPIVFKNLYNSMRLAPLAEAFPEASFLVCRRDVTDVALSLLRARVDNEGSTERWVSLPPRQIDALRRLDVPDQVAGQVICTYEQIDQDRERLGDERFLDVDYADLCHDPAGELARVGAFLEGRGVEVRARGDVPAAFSPATAQPTTPEEIRVAEAVARWSGGERPIGGS
jgi:hypothetical protein